MLLEVPGLVRELVPEARAIESMSVACVHTTCPKYLVFEADDSRPAFVVQFGPKDQLERTHRTLARVHACVGDIVPQPLVCAPAGMDEYVQIQTGLPGLPWFRVADRCRSRADWLDLLHRGLDALGRLRAAIAAVPEWTGTVHPGHELRKLVLRSRELHDAALASAAAPWIAALDRMGSMPAAYCHGDFSVNNLLIGDSGIGIIDFDEFGETMMPLHDEIGLALSFPLSQHGVCPLTIRECLQLCLAPAAARSAFDTDAVHGLLLHHLLWRIERCRNCPARDGLRRTLARYLRELLVTPGGLIGEDDLRPAITSW
jgi:hypothetical protein